MTPLLTFARMTIHREVTCKEGGGWEGGGGKRQGS